MGTALKFTIEADGRQAAREMANTQRLVMQFARTAREKKFSASAWWDKAVMENAGKNAVAVRVAQEREAHRMNQFLDAQDAALHQKKLARIASMRQAQKARTGVVFGDVGGPPPPPKGWREKFGDAMDSTVGRFAGGLAVGYAAVRFTRDAINADLAYQRIKNTLKAASGSAADAALDFEFLRGVAHKTGSTVLDMGDDFARFSVAAKSAGVSVKDTHAIFEAFTTTGAAMGLGADRHSQIVLALGQMLSKKFLSMEELKRQLSESFPQAMDVFAKAMGVGTDEMIKMIEKGDVLASSVLPKVANILGTSAEISEELLAIGEYKQAILDLQAAAGRGARPVVTEIAKGLAVELGWIEKIAATAGVLAGSIGMGEGGHAAARSLTKEIWHPGASDGSKRQDINSPEYKKAHYDAPQALRDTWKQINRELAKAVEKYNSMASTMDRLGKQVIAYGTHQANVLEAEKQNELAGATTDKQRYEIEQRYSAKQLANKKATQDSELSVMRAEENSYLDDYRSADKARREKEREGLDATAEREKMKVAVVASEEINQAIKDKELSNDAENSRDAELESLRLKGLGAKNGGTGFKPILTDQQQHGAFSAFGNVALLDVSKNQLHTQKQMLAAITALAGKSKGRGVHFGGTR